MESATTAPDSADAERQREPSADATADVHRVEAEGQTEAREGIELARHGDPSLSDRRAKLLEKVRDRSGLHWLPATEAIRRTNTTVARTAYGVQARVGTSIRDTALHPIATTRAARDRLARLGKPHPVHSRDTSAVSREGISR